MKKLLAILVLLFLFPISNSFGAMVTEVQNDDVENSTTTADFLTGIHFNNGFIENFLLASNMLTLKWKIKIIDVAAVAIAKPIFP